MGLQFNKNENEQDFSTCGQILPVSNSFWRLRASYNIYSAEFEYSNILCCRVWLYVAQFQETRNCADFQ